MLEAVLDILLVLPILIPFSMAIISVLNWGQRQLHRFLALTATVSMLLVAVVLLLAVQEEGIKSTQIGNWPAPFGLLGLFRVDLSGVDLLQQVFHFLAVDVEVAQRAG